MDLFSQNEIVVPLTKKKTKTTKLPNKKRNMGKCSKSKKVSEVRLLKLSKLCFLLYL